MSLPQVSGQDMHVPTRLRTNLKLNLFPDESGSDSEAMSSSSSCSSLSDLVTELVSENEKRHSMDSAANNQSGMFNANGGGHQGSKAANTCVLASGLNLAAVYRPPKTLNIPGKSSFIFTCVKSTGQLLTFDHLILERYTNIQIYKPSFARQSAVSQLMECKE